MQWHVRDDTAQVATPRLPTTTTRPSRETVAAA
jgi:hypothetical protein